MNIQIDKNNYVTGFSPTEMSDSVVYDGELPEGFQKSCRMYKLINGELIFDENRQREAEQQEALQQELNGLYDWFDWYDNQAAQYSRCVRTGEVYDKDIETLDAAANINQQRIREIRTILNVQ